MLPVPVCSHSPQKRPMGEDATRLKLGTALSSVKGPWSGFLLVAQIRGPALRNKRVCKADYLDDVQELPVAQSTHTHTHRTTY